MCIYIFLYIHIHIFRSICIYSYRYKYISGSRNMHLNCQVQTLLLKEMDIHIYVIKYASGKTSILAHSDISLYDINKNTDRGIMSKLHQYIPYCYKTVTLLVYRRLNTEQNLSLSLQYQLPLDSSLCLVSQHGW